VGDVVLRKTPITTKRRQPGGKMTLEEDLKKARKICPFCVDAIENALGSGELVYNEEDKP
jgi:hypothetical protein